MRIAPLLLALSLVCAPVAAAQVEMPSQCRDYGAVFDFYGGSSHFQHFGLSVGQCRAQCVKHAARCKKFLKLARTCTRKAIADRASIEIATLCNPIDDRAARDACRREARDEAATQQSAHDAEVAELTGNCDVVVRGWCSDECEGS
jgi:hypothetical protein